jgi:hypothetical protein
LAPRVEGLQARAVLNILQEACELLNECQK